MSQTTIDLHIEQLILHGFAAVDRDQLVSAVQQELARLFSEEGAAAALAGSRVAGRVDGGSFALTPNMSVETIGTHVAQAIYGGIVTPWA